MTRKIFFLAITFLFFLSLISVKANYAECYCTFDDELVVAQTAEFAECMERCGKVVGGQTDCDNDCENCCQSWCFRLKEDDSRPGCLDSCQKTCDFKKVMFDIISLFYIAAGIVAAVMLTLNGIRLFSSESPPRREEAKRGIWYTLLALAIVVMGGMIVTYLMKGMTKPGSEAEPIESVIGCGGVILNVRHTPLGEDIEVSTEFKNSGLQRCKYSVILYDANEEEVGSGVTWVNPNEFGTIKIATTRSELEGAYSVRLFEVVTADYFKEKQYWGPVPV